VTAEIVDESERLNETPASAGPDEH
jgi:hypothetical protein